MEAKIWALGANMRAAGIELGGAAFSPPGGAPLPHLEVDELRGEVERLTTERNDLRDEMDRLTWERDDLRDEVDRLKEDRDT